MVDLRDVSKKNIAVTGRIPGFTKAEIEILLKARGAWLVGNSPSKNMHLVIAEELEGRKVDKARALGLPVVAGEDVRAALGAPLEGFRARITQRVAELPDFYKLATFHVGEPASPALLDRIAERIGFPLPAAAQNLFTQLNGLSLLWTMPELPMKVEGPLKWSDAMHQDGELWRALTELSQRSRRRGFTMGLICIPDLETLFFSEWEDRVFYADVPSPKATLKIGKRKALAKDFYGKLFLLDAFHGYYQAGLWADPVSQELFVVYGSDYGADWTWSTPIPFEVYMEYLCWELGSNRLIDPAAKLGMTKAMSRLHPRSWIQLEAYRDL